MTNASMIQHDNTPSEIPLELVVACKRGEKDAWQELALRTYPFLRMIASRHVPTDDVEDMAQQTILQVLQRIDSFRGESRFTTWLYRVAINECLQYKRQRNQYGLLEDGTSLRSREDAVEQQFDKKVAVQEAIDRLPQELKWILVLHQFEGWTYRDISIRFRIPMGTVASRLSQARIQLKRYLTELGVNGEALQSEHMNANNAIFEKCQNSKKK